MDFLKKIQNLPLKRRKIILWITVAVLGIILIFLYIRITVKRLQGMEAIKLPFIKEELKKSSEKEPGEEKLGEDSLDSPPLFEMSPETKKDLEKLLEDALKELQESETK